MRAGLYSATAVSTEYRVQSEEILQISHVPKLEFRNEMKILRSETGVSERGVKT
jgi:hypothetical protein